MRALTHEEVHHGRPCDCAESWRRIEATQQNRLTVCGACGVALYESEPMCPWCNAVRASC